MGSYKGSGANDAWIDVLLSQANLNYDTAKYLRGLRKIESVTGGAGRLLDIGCSIGLFLKIAEENEWDALGLELNRRAVDHAREAWGLKVTEELLHRAAFDDGGFDAVTLWGVIEHLQDPEGVIREVNRVLQSGGALLTFCPNVESLVCRVLHDRTSCFDGRNHCGYFSPTTITYLLEKCGFVVVDIESHQPELDTVLNHLDFDAPYLKGSDKANPIKELLGPAMISALDKLILDRKLGYKMMTLARKS